MYDILDRFKKQKGFTLAEVLVTLAVIGVVAALTIPALVKGIEEVKYKTMFRKHFSQLSQAINLLRSEGQNLDPYFCGSNWNKECLRDLFERHIKFVKKSPEFGESDCSIATNYEKYFPSPMYYYSNSEFDPQSNTKFENGCSAATLDGAIYLFNYYGQDYDSTLSCNGRYMIKIIVDTNGLNSPNTVGKDIHLLVIERGKLIPTGLQQNCTPAQINEAYGYSKTIDYLK